MAKLFSPKADGLFKCEFQIVGLTNSGTRTAGIGSE